jgi:hypothetical protein
VSTTTTTRPHLQLSAWERDVLDHEAWYWKYAEDAIRVLYGLSPIRYYQRLNELLDTERALAAEPVLVNRLRRIRDSRQLAREVRRTSESSTTQGGLL